MEQAHQADAIVDAVLKSLKSQLRDVLKEEIAQSGVLQDLIKSELASSASMTSNAQTPSSHTNSAAAPAPKPSTPATNGPPPTATLQQQPLPQRDSFEAALALVGLKTEDSPQQRIPATTHSGWPTLYAHPRGSLPTPNTTPMPPPRPSRRHAERNEASGKRSRSVDDEDGTRPEWMPITTLGANGSANEFKRRRTADTDSEPVTPTSADGDEYNHYNPHSHLPPYQPPTTRQAHRNELFNQPHFTHLLQHLHTHNTLADGRGHYSHTHEDPDDDYDEASFVGEEDHEGCHCREFIERVVACRDLQCPIQYLRTSDPNLNKRPNSLAVTPSRSRASTPTSPSIAATSKKSSPRPPIWKCDQCGTTTTSQRRPGPKGRSTLCNACWTRGRKKSKAAAQQAAQEKAQQEKAAAQSISGISNEGDEIRIKAEKSSSSSSAATIASPDKNNKEHSTRAAAKTDAAVVTSTVAASADAEGI
ncbi:hypothetical protein SeMB42_g07602 [Synchytrium endobioticum]|uniref:GATA-type domain-containing protein n=1 Tax=Synchytrium endobioticum TaxID=286115 RepID=A0A507C4Z1_9FUNG|nr:hypothetical protein SeMB42_g07602 [Synchytrium endobioticum]TPX44573.1 hypothetical protein SeLEV6574_g04412 [Synchytrium endobioticum]